MCRRTLGPFFLRIQGQSIKVYGEECLMLACQVSAAYHDWLAYNAPLDDGFEQDMEEREAYFKARWEEPITDGSDDGY